MKETSREEKIAKIYEVIANKALSFGDIVTSPTHGTGVFLGDGRYYFQHNNKMVNGMSDEMIIGKKMLMIGDILDWYCNTHHSKTYGPKEYQQIDRLRDLKRKEIGEQEQDCIDFIHSLVSNEG